MANILSLMNKLSVFYSMPQRQDRRRYGARQSVHTCEVTNSFSKSQTFLYHFASVIRHLTCDNDCRHICLPGNYHASLKCMAADT